MLSVIAGFEEIHVMAYRVFYVQFIDELNYVNRSQINNDL